MSLPVDVIRSTRRRRTIQAYVVGGRVRVLIPDGLPVEEERRLVETIVAKVLRRHEAGTIDLDERVRQLAERYRLPIPKSIAWSNRQDKRWGSCTTPNGTIRISARLANMPSWVLDYVIVHELAHLVHRGHGEPFRALLGRYELAERARGYLLAKAEEPQTGAADGPGDERY